MSPIRCVRCGKPLNGFSIGFGEEPYCLACGHDRMNEIIHVTGLRDDLDRELLRAASAVRAQVGKQIESTAEWREGMLHAANLVEQMACPAGRETNRIEATADNLLRAAARDAKITIEALRGRGRDPRTIRARDLVCARLHAAGLSLPTIGRLVNRDHTTVLYAIRKVADPEAAQARNDARGRRAKERANAKLRRAKS